MSRNLAAVDHVELALAKLPAYLQKQRWQELVTAIAEEIQEADDAIVAVVAQLHLDDATDAMLDRAGAFVGQPRAGMDDDAYRLRIKGRIAVLRSLGLVEDLNRLARLLLVDDGYTIAVSPEPPAGLTLVIGGTVGTPAATARALADAAQASVSGGVRTRLESSTEPDADTFRLAAGVGSSPYIALFDLTGGDFSTTVVLSAYGEASNDQATLSVVADAGAPDDGEWAAGFPDFVFHFKDNVTTIADFEAAITAGQSAYLTFSASVSGGTLQDGSSSFSNVPFAGATDATSDAERLGLAGSPPTLDLTPLLAAGSGYDGTIGYRAFGAEHNGLYTLAFVEDAGAPNSGTLDETDPTAIVFTFKGGTTTTAHFHLAIAASEYLFIDHAPTVGVVTFAATDDEFAATAFAGATGDGGVLADVLE